MICFGVNNWCDDVSASFQPCVFVFVFNSVVGLPTVCVWGWGKVNVVKSFLTDEQTNKTDLVCNTKKKICSNRHVSVNIQN